jgi:hypothetical protein
MYLWTGCNSLLLLLLHHFLLFEFVGKKYLYTIQCIWIRFLLRNFIMYLWTGCTLCCAGDKARISTCHDVTRDARLAKYHGKQLKPSGQFQIICKHLQKNQKFNWDMEVCVSYYCACDVWLTDWRGDFAILYLAQSFAPVSYGIDANGCQCVKPNGNRKWIFYPRFLSKN